MRIKLSLLALAAASAVGAQTLPNGYEATEGNSNFFLFPGAATRTFMWMVDANQLTSYVGSNLNGIQFRLDAAATAAYPAAAFSMASFDLRIGAGVDPSAKSSTFASNFAGTPTLVRTGALTIPIGDYGVSSSPRPWGSNISFSDYLYTGGHLTIEARMTTNTGGQGSFDAVLNGSPGYGTDFNALWATSNTATTASILDGRFVIMKLNATAVPEPATLAALGIGALAMLRRRRRA